jgi:hypothetical protein
VSYNKKYGIGSLKKHIFNEPIEDYRRYGLIMAKVDKSWRSKEWNLKKKLHPSFSNHIFFW